MFLKLRLKRLQNLRLLIFPRNFRTANDDDDYEDGDDDDGDADLKLRQKSLQDLRFLKFWRNFRSACVPKNAFETFAKLVVFSSYLVVLT